MAVITMYKATSYREEHKKLFSGVYNDFRNKACSEYNFELQPLSYDKFVKSIDDGLLDCIILFEDNIPTGFLVYTSMISESLELNIIHCMGSENINEKRKLLLEKFLEINKPMLKEKVVTYPMLGKQSSFVDEISNYGFKTVNTSVNLFTFSDINSINALKLADLPELSEEYEMTEWKSIYFKDVAEIIHQAFKNSSDCLFDSRFESERGCRDILEKIVQNTYGDFLPDATKILLYKGHPVGFCFANLTNEKIANIPLIGVIKRHRKNGFGRMMLKAAVTDILNKSANSNSMVEEINATCDTDNSAVTAMYKMIGFETKYTYAQAYRPRG